MPVDKNIMCYAAKMPDDVGYFAIAVDNPEHKKSLAKDIAGWIKEGAYVERVPIDKAKEGFIKYCEWDKCRIKD
jgi:hypothetical protein